ncbi:zinc-dependent metalloprotease family protein [Halomarina rubra]|uniref:Zinc-dependent metalloprotease family protein n=1 Tax=Halomarina rubra TaxID=2071873 RepID=A0ABD6ATE9_9EURY|nr:zinc-dependent metalloprotease family protein [Halomarina rubra]
MTRRVTALALLCCVVLAGCSAPVTLPEVGDSDPGDADGPSPGGTVTERTDSTAEPGARSTAEATGGSGTDRPNGGEGARTLEPTVEPRDNPYEEGTLTVAVDATNVSADRDVRTAVREALDYWEANATRYAGYDVEYRLLAASADASDADVVVRFVDEIVDCGRDQHVAGCAPYITRGPVERPVVVRLQTGYDDDSTRLVLQHELGHTLGLDHDDPPQDVMSSRAALTSQPRTDASEREFAWNHSTLSVYVDYGAAEDRAAAERQVDAALGYFADGAAGTVPDNVSFVRVDDPRRADVTITFAETLPCDATGGSCGRLGGFDPDRDGALETYTSLDITVADLDTEAVAWHVARWVGLGLSLDGDDEFPEPLRQSASPGERRSEWWR